MTIFDLSKYFGQYGYDNNRNFVPFYGNRGQDLFGNFWQFSRNMEYCGIKANNVEALYHAMKFPDEIRKKFNKLGPLEAFHLSRRYKNYIRKDWDEIKEDIMLDLLRIKFRKPICSLVLLLTGSKYLVEHNPVKGRDSFWSDDNDGSGKNRLGILLMKIRRELFGMALLRSQKTILNG